MEGFPFKNLCAPGKMALVCFTLSAFIFIVTFFTGYILGYAAELTALPFWGPALYFCLINFILRYMYTGFTYEVSCRSTFLGAAFSTGLYLTTYNNGWRVFGLYMMILSFFHFSEFMAVAMTNPTTLTIDSFILNHSIQYGLAAVASWIEWAVEYYYFPDLKTYFWLSAVGVVMCVGGEIFRKSAMFTARTNFNHTVQFVKRPEHQLVTHGVYSLCRHPSYVGWFYWSIGTQVTLLNPVCLIIYTLASWSFFRERVFAEELTLLAFFGEQYIAYQRDVGTGLPLIKGVTNLTPTQLDAIRNGLNELGLDSKRSKSDQRTINKYMTLRIEETSSSAEQRNYNLQVKNVDYCSLYNNCLEPKVKKVPYNLLYRSFSEPLVNALPYSLFYRIYSEPIINDISYKTNLELKVKPHPYSVARNVLYDTCSEPLD